RVALLAGADAAQRLDVVAGHLAVRPAAATGGVGVELALEVGARGGVIARLQARGGGGRGPPRPAARTRPGRPAPPRRAGRRPSRAARRTPPASASGDRRPPGRRPA